MLSYKPETNQRINVNNTKIENHLDVMTDFEKSELNYQVKD